MKNKGQTIRRRLIPLLLAVMLSLVSLTACAQQDAKKAAKGLLDACIACDGMAYAAIMGSEERVSLTDVEIHTLTRMTYRIVSAKVSGTRAVITADIRIIDLMNTLNMIFLYTNEASKSETEFDPNMMLLELLNSGDAEYGMFRAEIPLTLQNDSWALDTASVGDDLRDALSGGSYSWWKLYNEYYLK